MKGVDIAGKPFALPLAYLSLLLDLSNLLRYHRLKPLLLPPLLPELPLLRILPQLLPDLPLPLKHTPKPILLLLHFPRSFDLILRLLPLFNNALLLLFRNRLAALPRLVVHQRRSDLWLCYFYRHYLI